MIYLVIPLCQAIASCSRRERNLVGECDPRCWFLVHALELGCSSQVLLFLLACWAFLRHLAVCVGEINVCISPSLLLSAELKSFE